VIHVYGVVDELGALPSLAGLEDAPLERRRVGDLELVVSRVPGAASGEVSRDAVLRHAQVVEELMDRSRAVLPAQFGREFGDEDELDAAVRTQSRELERGLSRVRGCEEFGLRAVGELDTEEVPAASSGAEYMRVRLAESKRRGRLIEELHEPLARLSRATVLAAGDSRSLLEAAYLVPAESIAEFRDAVLRLEREWPELTIVCSGPWPPYSFASGPEEAG
jgi:hypothetical protein